MNPLINETLMASLQEATRLTQAGQLQDATAMIQRALSGESSPEHSAAPNQSDSTFQAKTGPGRAWSGRTQPGRGGILEGSCHVVDERSEARQESSARRKAAQPEQVQTTTPRQSFATDQNVGGLGELLRGKLAGLQEGLQGGLPGLDTGFASPAEALSDGAKFISGSFASQAGSRDYKLYIPSGYHGQALPLVVMLHGCTQNPDDFAAGTGMNALAETQPCLVLYPAQPASANHTKCWNWFKPSDQQRERGEPAIIAGMTRQVIDEYQLDEKRVYVAGLSAGGAMATTLAMTYPELYAAVGVHSGLPHGAAQDLPSALAAMQGGSSPLASLNQRAEFRAASSTTRNIPAIIFHGDRDTTVHPSNGERVAAQYLPSASPGNAARTAPHNAPRSGIDTQSKRGQVPSGHAYTCTTHQDADGQAILEQWSIHGAGHAWAGGAYRGTYTDPKGPDASKEMLRFFLSHTKG